MDYDRSSDRRNHLSVNVNRTLLDDLLQQLARRLEVPAPVVHRAQGRADLLRQTFLEDVEVPLALNNVTDVLLVKRQQVTRHVQRGVEGHRDTAVQTDRRIKDAIEVAERDAALRLVVDEEAQGVRGLEVEEHADGRALLYATVRPLRVTAAVHEPRALPVYVHAPALVVLTCGQTIRNIAPPRGTSEACSVCHANDRMDSAQQGRSSRNSLRDDDDGARGCFRYSAPVTSSHALRIFFLDQSKWRRGRDGDC